MEATGQLQASGLCPGEQVSDDQWTGGWLASQTVWRRDQFLPFPRPFSLKQFR